MLGFFFFLGFSNVEEEGQVILLEPSQPLYFFVLSLGISEATTNSPFVAMPLNQTT
jgi:hypothetical protein